MTQRRVSSWRAQWTCVGGTCAPPAAPPRNALERALDRYTDLTAPLFRGCYAFTVAGVSFLASALLGQRGGLWLAGGYFLALGAYCLANFARCREAHCIVTGIGWSALAGVSVWGALAGRALRGTAWAAFLLIAVAGHLFEAFWTAAHGSNELRLGGR
jgi:hypothetical protein